MRHDCVTIAVHVHPGSRHPGVGGTHGGSLVVRVGAPAAHGAANDAVLAALADVFDLRRGDVTFVRITRSRDKIVTMRGDPAALARRRDELLAAPG